MTTYRLFGSGSGGNGFNGPATANGFSGSFISGMQFCVTAEAWFQGYWWWVSAAGGQNTTATKCALWQFPNNNGTPQLVPGSVVTSGTLTAGQWNYIPLATPIPLSLGGSPGLATPVNNLSCASYVAAIGCNGPFPDTNNYWGASQPGANGIQNGPLLAYSADAGTMHRPAGNFQGGQGCFASGGSSDPSVAPPTGSSGTDNFCVDVQVADYATIASQVAGTSFRLWPSNPEPHGFGANADTGAAVSGTAFTLSQPCSLSKIWFWSPSGATGLPSRVGIWNSNTQTIVSGTDNASPSWSGAAASGWVSVSYAGVTLPGGHYIVAYFNGNGVKMYSDVANHFFAGTAPGVGTVGGPAWNGISYGGVLSAPNVANGPSLVYDDGSGTHPGQCAYTGPTAHTPTSTWVYPVGFEASGDWGETRWADVEVVPVASGSGLLMASIV